MVPGDRSEGQNASLKYSDGITPDLLLNISGLQTATDQGTVIPSEERTAERKKLHASILKRIELGDAVSDKTQARLETRYKKFLSKIMKSGAKPELVELEDAVGAMVCETGEETGINSRICGLKEHAPYLFKHSIRCGIIAGQVTSSLHYSDDDSRLFATAMILHDAGMLALPAEFLNRNEYSDEDMAELRKHSVLGFKLLTKVPGMDMLSAIVAYSHHALADGSGYPGEVDLNTLPPLAQLAPVIDNFEALTADRPGGYAASPHVAVGILTENRDRYHPAALDGFLRAIGVFPVNTFLKLDTGEVGVVVRNNQDNLSMPVIKLLADPAGKPYASEIIVDMMHETDRNIAGEV